MFLVWEFTKVIKGLKTGILNQFTNSLENKKDFKRIALVLNKLSISSKRINCFTAHFFYIKCMSKSTIISIRNQNFVLDKRLKINVNN